jgi:N-acetylglucosamine-6-sulfatase
MPDSRPNILYIMADDHSANAISAYQSILAPTISTPNIDRIGREGAIATNCFCTNSICTPSRASILTGRYGHSTGVRTLSDSLDPATPTVARRLQAAGYQTALFGKWHLHTDPQGFDDYRVLRGQGEYWNPVFRSPAAGGVVEQAATGYATDIITDACLDWLDRTDRSKPFFLLCHHKAPHDNWDYAREFSDLYRDTVFPEPASLDEDKSHRSAASRDFGSSLADLARERLSQPWYPTGPMDIAGLSDIDLRSASYQRYVRDYARCVASIDQGVGRLLDFLDRAGLADNTVVYYTSDQGEFLGEHDYWDKRWMFEESLRMPLLVRYPREIPAGSVVDDMVLNIDVAPTFVDYGAAQALDESDGQSFRRLLTGERVDGWRTSMYYRYWMHLTHLNVPAHYGIRTAEHKLIFYYGLGLDATDASRRPTTPGWELYDLRADPLERRNVFEEPSYDGVVADLLADLDRLKSGCADRDDGYPDLLERRRSTVAARLR